MPLLHPELDPVPALTANFRPRTLFEFEQHHRFTGINEEIYSKAIHEQGCGSEPAYWMNLIEN